MSAVPNPYTHGDKHRQKMYKTISHLQVSSAMHTANYAVNIKANIML